MGLRHLGTIGFLATVPVMTSCFGTASQKSISGMLFAFTCISSHLIRSSMVSRFLGFSVSLQIFSISIAQKEWESAEFA